MNAGREVTLEEVLGAALQQKFEREVFDVDPWDGPIRKSAIPPPAGRPPYDTMPVKPTPQEQAVHLHDALTSTVHVLSNVDTELRIVTQEIENMERRLTDLYTTKEAISRQRSEAAAKVGDIISEIMSLLE